jgi:predicted kinase
MEISEHKVELGYERGKRDSKHLIIMCGWPGTGKTTIANHLAQGIERSVLINRDAFKDPNDLKENVTTALRYKVVPRLNYKVLARDVILYTYAEKQLQKFDTIIVDGTFHRRDKRNRAYEHAKRWGCEPVLIYCTCSLKEAWRRLKHQIEQNEKSFKFPLQDVLFDYEKHFDDIMEDTLWPIKIKVNTENTQKPMVEELRFRDKSVIKPSAYIQQLIQILKKPLSPLSLHERLIVSNTMEQMKDSVFKVDVFLAYDSHDETSVAAIARELKRRGLIPWFDKLNLPPDLRPQLNRGPEKKIERVLPRINSVALFVGPSGILPWQKLEINAAIIKFLKRESPIVIPVLLPGTIQPVLPNFLQEFKSNWVRFKNEINELESIDNLTKLIKEENQVRI